MNDKHADARDAKRIKRTKMAIRGRSIFTVERVLGERAEQAKEKRK